MLHNYLLLYRCKLQTLPFIRTYSRYRPIPKTIYSSKFTTSFLKNKCGLTGKTLIRVSNLVNFESSDKKPESVLQLFQNFEFSKADIIRIVITDPRILFYCPQKCLRPKFDFLLSITHSQSELVNIVAKNPIILKRSLNNHLVPFFDLLKSVTGSDQNAVAAVKCNPFVLSELNSTSFLQNIEFLQTLNVPQTQILKFITKYGQPMGVEHEKFSKIVMKVKEMGFDLSSSNFITAVQSLSVFSDLAWESRCEIYRSFGFSNDNIFFMFMKQPAVMLLSGKKIRATVKFIVNKLRWSPSKLLATPGVLMYSLEKRIIPRCSVLQALVSRKCKIKRLTLSSLLHMTEIEFVEKFVTAHKGEILEVMDAYHGNLRFDEYNIELGGKSEFRACS